MTPSVVDYREVVYPWLPPVGGSKGDVVSMLPLIGEHIGKICPWIPPVGKYRGVICTLAFPVEHRVKMCPCFLPVRNIGGAVTMDSS